MHRYSGITVKELLNIESMKGAKILAGEKGLNKRVTKLNVMEVPDIIDWVEEGEFLLTTAFSIRDRLDELEELITQLNNRGLAGIGIKTKRYIDEIPRACIDKANQLGFAIIEIPYDVSYSDILVEGLAEIVNAHASTLHRINNIQTKLINVMLNGGGLKEIANAIHNSMDGNSIAIKDYMFEKCVFLGDESNRKFIEDVVETVSLMRKRPQGNHINSYSSFETIDEIAGREIRRTMVPISSGSVEYGCMFIWEDKKVLSPLERTAIKASTPIIALDIYKNLSIFEIESKQKIEFFEDLFSGSESRFNKAIERAPYFEFDANLSYSVIIISFNEDERIERYDLNNSTHIQKIKVKLLNIIQRISKTSGQNITCATKSNSVIVLFGSNPDLNERIVRQSIKYFCEEILDSIKHEYFRDDVYIAIGRNYTDVREVWKSYKEASRAIEYQKRTSSSRIIYYDDLGIYRILSFEGLQPELEQIYKETLKPLVMYDMERGTDLVLTLNKYFECEGNLKDVSEKLFIHYNTAVYRLQRIKEITGVDFDDYNDRLNLQIALKILEMYDNDDN